MIQALPGPQGTLVLWGLKLLYVLSGGASTEGSAESENSADILKYPRAKLMLRNRLTIGEQRSSSNPKGRGRFKTIIHLKQNRRVGGLVLKCNKYLITDLYF